MNKISSIFLASAFVISANAASATVITEFTNRTIFDAAVGSTQIEDFTDSAHFPITSGVLNSSTTDAGLNAGDIVDGVTFSTPVGSGLFFNIDSGAGYDGGFLDSLRSSGDRALTVTFDAPVAAFGFDTNGQMGSAFDVTINFDAGSPFTDTLRLLFTSLRFFGFQSDEADIASVVIQGNNTGTSGANYALDNFSFGGQGSGPTEELPEPGMLGLARPARRPDRSRQDGGGFSASRCGLRRPARRLVV